MKLITFQHANILNELNKDGIYNVSVISKYHQHTPNCYKILSNKLQEVSEEQCDIPVFTWQQAYFNKLIDINQIDRMSEMVKVPKNYLGFELEVPDNLVLLTSFYDFVDARCIEEGIDQIPNFTWDSVWNIKNKYEIQAIIPYIKKEWIKNIYRIKTLVSPNKKLHVHNIVIVI